MTNIEETNAVPVRTIIGFLKDAVKLEEDYQKLLDEKRLTKKAMCDLCIPFRDKYGLTDSQTLRIARSEVTHHEIIAIATEVAE